MARRKLTVVLLPHGSEGYEVFFPRFPGVITDGRTVDEVLKNAKEAMELYLEEAGEDHLERLAFSHVPHIVVGEVEVQVPERAGATTRR